MNKRYLATGLFLLAAAPAQAITFATGQGTDGAGCGAVTAPCRTLQQAVANTPGGGYVVLQGPANFGRATIEKSLTIVGEAGAALSGAVAPTHEDVVTIFAGANDIVRIRGLTITDAPLGSAGVLSARSKRLEVADCVISQTAPATQSFQGAGVMAMWLDGGQLAVVDTTINASMGVFAGSQNQRISSYLDGLRITASYAGLWMGQGWNLTPLTVLVNSSVANAPTGLRSLSGDLIVHNSTVSNGSEALILDIGATRLSRSTITGNAKAVNARTPDGKLFTYGDNTIRGNADDSLPQTKSATYH